MAVILAHLLYGAVIIWLGLRNHQLKQWIDSVASLPPSMSPPVLSLPLAPPMLSPEIPPDFCINSNDAQSLLQLSFPPLANKTDKMAHETIEIVPATRLDLERLRVILALTSLPVLLALATAFHAIKLIYRQQERQSAKETVGCGYCTMSTALLEEKQERLEQNRNRMYRMAQRRDSWKQKFKQQLVLHKEAVRRSLLDIDRKHVRTTAGPKKAHEKAEKAQPCFTADQRLLVEEISKRLWEAEDEDNSLPEKETETVTKAEKPQQKLEPAYNGKFDQLEQKLDKALGRLDNQIARSVELESERKRDTHHHETVLKDLKRQIEQLHTENEDLKERQSLLLASPMTPISPLTAIPAGRAKSPDIQRFNWAGVHPGHTAVTNADDEQQHLAAVSNASAHDSDRPDSSGVSTDKATTKTLSTRPTHQNGGIDTPTSRHGSEPELDSNTFYPADSQIETAPAQVQATTDISPEQQNAPPKKKILHQPEQQALRDEFGLDLPQLASTIQEVKHGFARGRSEESRVYQFNRKEMLDYSKTRSRYEKEHGIGVRTTMRYDRTESDEDDLVHCWAIFEEETVDDPSAPKRKLSYEEFLRERDLLPPPPHAPRGPARMTTAPITSASLQFAGPSPPSPSTLFTSRTTIESKWGAPALSKTDSNSTGSHPARSNNKKNDLLNSRFAHNGPRKQQQQGAKSSNSRFTRR